MRYIDPHIHMISRTTDDYQRMAYAQCAAVSEPAFWAGFDRGTARAFHDYFRINGDLDDVAGKDSAFSSEVFQLNLRVC